MSSPPTAEPSSGAAANAASAAPVATLRDDARTIGLVSLAHGISHFFHLLLPPLFPVFIREFGLTYSELGLLVTAFFVISGIGQAGAGFLVDRVGARPVLFVAMGCFVAAALAAAGAQGYGGLMVAAGLAGLGNSAFHPVDFTILNKRVSQSRLGHAFSAHGIAGNLGWAAAPVFMAGAMAVTGSWRLAFVAAAGLALLVTLVLALNRRAIDDRLGAWAHEKQPAGGPAAVPEHPMAFLRLPSVWMCFAFFFWSTAALSGVQAFAGPALQQIYGLPLSVSVFAVTAYMLCAAAGMVAGGFLVGRTQRLERNIALAMSVAAALLVVAGIGVLPGLAAATLLALAGAGVGVAGPSRDMLVKQASPPGATGRVYGTVYSGLDIGFALAAPVFGALMDHGQPNGVFYGSALALGMGIASAGLISLNVSRPRVSAAAAG